MKAVSFQGSHCHKTESSALHVVVATATSPSQQHPASRLEEGAGRRHKAHVSIMPEALTSLLRLLHCVFFQEEPPDCAGSASHWQEGKRRLPGIGARSHGWD